MSNFLVKKDNNKMEFLMQELSNYNPAHGLIIQIVSITFSSLSLLTTLLFLFLIYYFNNHKIPLFQMIINVFLADIIISISYLLIPPLLHDFDENLCFAQAFLSNFGELSSLAWSTVIFFSLYQTVVKLRKINNLEKKYYLISFGIPLILSAMFNNILHIYFNLFFCLDLS